MPRLLTLPGLLLVSLLMACQAPAPPAGTAPESDETAVESPPAKVEAPATDPVADEQFRRMLADYLYEGLRALREDRLMTPPENSAHAWFSRVLARDPDNELALEGMRDIVVRYVQLAERAARQGQFDNAETFLRRAAMVEPDHAMIAQAHQQLATERSRTHSVHMLEAGNLRQNDGAAATLAGIARILEEHDEQLFVLITAPNDELGRWIYTRIRERLGVQRLPGDIEIGARPSVRLIMR